MVDEAMRITVRVVHTGGDDAHLDDVTRQLRDELVNLDVAVDGGVAGPAPSGTKAVELAALGTLIVTLSQSTVLTAIATAIGDWLSRRQQRTVKLEVDGDVLELSGVASPEQRRLTDAWLRRHQTGSGVSPDGRHALIVATYAYEDPGLQQLRAPAHDAEQLARVLRDPAIGGFEVQTILNGSAPMINEAVEDFFADRSPDELLLLYFSSHGVKDADGDLYFAAAPTKLRRLGATAVAADFVNRRMNRSRSRRIVLLLDCCYAGAFGRGMVARAGSGIAIEEQFGGRGRAVITASSAMEYAFESDGLADARDGGPSVFTQALVEGLDTGDADRDQDGFVGLDELYDYVYEQVRRSTPNQTPGKWTFDVQGDLHIARRSRPVATPAPLPSELQEAIDHPLSGMRAGAVGELGRLVTSRHEGLALAARLALQRLRDDDSRTVSAAADAALESVTTVPRPVPATDLPPVRTVPRPGPAGDQAAPAPAAAPTPRPRPAHAQRPVTHPGASPTVAGSAPRDGAEQPATAGPVPPGGPRAGFAVGRVLAAASFVLLAVGFSTTFDRSMDLTLRTGGDLAAIWLAVLAGAAGVLLYAPPGRLTPEAARGAAFGLAPGLIGLLGGIGILVRSVDRLAIGFWVFAAGLLLIMVTAVLDMSRRSTRRRVLVDATVTALGLAALLVYLIGPSHVVTMDDDDQGWWLPIVLVSVVLLAVGAIRDGRRWRAGSARRGTLLGAVTAVLLIADVVVVLTVQNNDSFDQLRWAAAPVTLVAVVMIEALLDDDRRISLAVARLGLILGLLVTIAPLSDPRLSRTLVPEASAPALLHAALLSVAALAALGALYSAVRPEPAVTPTARQP